MAKKDMCTYIIEAEAKRLSELIGSPVTIKVNIVGLEEKRLSVLFGSPVKIELTANYYHPAVKLGKYLLKGQGTQGEWGYTYGYHAEYENMERAIALNIPEETLAKMLKEEEKFIEYLDNISKPIKAINKWKALIPNSLLMKEQVERNGTESEGNYED